MNRLTAAYEGAGWSRTYGYDQYGNRWVSSSSRILSTDVHEPVAASNFNATTNRISVAASTFDDSGNQTTFRSMDTGYDAENRNSTATSTSIGNGSFLYDGNGGVSKRPGRLTAARPVLRTTSTTPWDNLLPSTERRCRRQALYTSTRTCWEVRGW